MMEHTIRNTKSRLWLLEYPPGHSLHKLKWTWTLEWTNANRYPTKEAAEARAKELGITDWTAEPTKR